MNDLISRQDAIDVLNKLDVSDGVGISSIACDVQKSAISAIQHLPSAQRWIPCSERLPEFDTKVLAWVENKDPEGRFNSHGVYTATLRDKIPQHDPEGKRNFWGIPGYDSEWSVWSWSYFTEPDVKAWMPLPEPWRGEE